MTKVIKTIVPNHSKQLWGIREVDHLSASFGARTKEADGKPA